MKKLVPALAIVFCVTQASACSICIAHAIGAGLSGVGAQTLGHGKFTFGVSTLTFSKTQTSEEETEDALVQEKHDHQETTFELSYGLTDQLLLRSSLPYVTRGLTVGSDPAIVTQGLGDASLGFTYQLPPKWGDKVLLSFTGDIKFPTGRNSLKDSNGNLLEEHSQIGTGTTDYSAGLQATSELGRGLVFGSVSFRKNGTSDRDYRYGDVVFYSVGYSMTFDSQSSLILEFNGRSAKKDRMANGSFDENSGGQLGYLSISARRSLSKNLGLIVSYQSPIHRKLNGTQVESPILTIGLRGGF